MGAFVADGYVANVQEQLNRRFIGEALQEMVALQKEFKIFSLSPKHSLGNSFKLIGIAPVEEKDRAGFFKYLEKLTKTGSRVDDQPKDKNGHDQIITSLKENLESNRPSPVYFDYHPSGGTKPEVLITTRPSLSFSSKAFLNISVPTIPAGRLKAGARKK